MKTNHSHAHFTTSLPLSGYVLLVLLSGLMFFGCNKDSKPRLGRNSTMAQRVIEGSEADAIISRIEGFYDLMRSIEANDPPPNPETFSLDSAVFLTEAAYNYYVVKINDTDLTEGMAFSIDASLNSGRFEAATLSDVFYKIKDSLLVLENSINFQGKRLSFFNLEGSAVGNVATITVHARMTSKDLSPRVPCATIPDLVTTGPNAHWESAYKLNAQSNLVTYQHTSGLLNSYKYGHGYAEFEHKDLIANPPVATAVHNSNFTSIMGAEWMLKDVFRANYFCSHTGNERPTCATPIDLEVVSWNFAGGENSITTTHDYGNRGIANFPSYKVFTNFETTTGLAPAYNSNDPDPLYKDWLTASMLNYYYSYLYGIVTSETPNNKSFLDIDVIYHTARPVPFSGNPTMKKNWHHYDIAYCVYVNTCFVGMNLSQL